MNAQAQSHGERRKNQRSHMTDDQFRDFTLDSLEEGRKQFEALDGRLDTLTSHIKTMADALSENTVLTKKTAEQSQKTAELAQQTADDTAGLVRVAKFGEATADVVTTGTRGASKVSVVLIPILVVGSILGAIWHGQWPSWKIIMEAIK